MVQDGRLVRPFLSPFFARQLRRVIHAQDLSDLLHHIVRTRRYARRSEVLHCSRELRKPVLHASDGSPAWRAGRSSHSRGGTDARLDDALRPFAAQPRWQFAPRGPSLGLCGSLAFTTLWQRLRRGGCQSMSRPIRSGRICAARALACCLCDLIVDSAATWGACAWSSWYDPCKVCDE